MVTAVDFDVAYRFRSGAAPSGASPLGAAGRRAVGTAARRIPAVIACDNGRLAALGNDVPGFESFDGLGDVHRARIEHQGRIGVHAVIAGRNSRLAAIEIDVHVGMDAVVVGGHVQDAGIDMDEVARNDSLAAGLYRYLGSRYGVGKDDLVECLDAIIARLDREFSAGNLDDSFGGIGNNAFVLALVTLDAVTFLGDQRIAASFDVYGVLAFQGVVLCRHVDCGDILDAQVIGGVDAVVVVARDGKRPVSLEGDVFFGVDDAAGRVHLGASVLGVAPGLRAAGCVLEAVGRAVQEDKEYLVGALHVDGGVRGAGEIQVVEVEIDFRVFAGRNDYLEIVRCPGEIVIAGAGNGGDFPVYVDAGTVVVFYGEPARAKDELQVAFGFLVDCRFSGGLYYDLLARSRVVHYGRRRTCERRSRRREEGRRRLPRFGSLLCRRGCRKRCR